MGFFGTVSKSRREFGGDWVFWFLAPALVLMHLATVAWSAPLIEVEAARTVTVSQIMDSPVVSSRWSEVREAAMAKLASDSEIDVETRERIAAALDELPFRRIIDIELVFPGIIDTIGICLEGHPTNEVAVEACATSMIFISNLSLAVKYRWDLVLSQTASGKRFHQLQLGPSAGIRSVTAICFDACTDTQIRGDIQASLEYVFWLSRHFGLTAQLDAGASFFIANIDNPAFGTNTVTPVWPLAKLSVGVAF